MTNRDTALTGIKPTGLPHLGNYVGAIRPALSLVERFDAFYFVADYHALTSETDAERLHAHTRSVAATWIACGLNPNRSILYRQSDIPETFELAWILACITAKGLLNRAHAYKGARDRNRTIGVEDLDSGINMGMYNYPILMAADILIMQTDVVPVGSDQVQHLEYARDIAERFNALYGKEYSLTVPKRLDCSAQGSGSLPGLDGRKMSKSYENTVPLFCERTELQSLVKRFKTDSTSVDDPKDPESSPLFAIYREFASSDDTITVRHRLLTGGMGWGELKGIVFDQLEDALAKPRQRYRELVNDPRELESVLVAGARRARDRAARVLAGVRRAIGVM